MASAKSMRLLPSLHYKTSSRDSAMLCTRERTTSEAGVQKAQDETSWEEPPSKLAALPLSSP